MKILQSFVWAILVLMAFPHYTFSQTTSSSQISDSLTTVTIKVKGITCSMDVGMISTNVEKIDGVNSCKPGKTGTTTTFEVRYNPAKVSEKDIHSAIESTGSCENPNERPYKVKR